MKVDDAEDVEVVSVLLDPPVPEGFDISTTDTLPGVTNMACNLQVIIYTVLSGQLPFYGLSHPKYIDFGMNDTTETPVIYLQAILYSRSLSQGVNLPSKSKTLLIYPS